MKPGNPPAFSAGMVPIPADTSIREMRGIRTYAANPLRRQGIFLPLAPLCNTVTAI